MISTQAADRGPGAVPPRPRRATPKEPLRVPTRCPAAAFESSSLCPGTRRNITTDASGRPYWCACFLAFAAFAFLRRSSPDAHAPRRVLETPHAYLLGFHFVFILSGFAAHGLRTRVVASLRVASAFLAAAGVVAAAQLVLAPPALVAALAACVAAGARLRALVEDALGDAGAAGAPGDAANFWQ